MKFVSLDEAVSAGYLENWYIDSVASDRDPVWTEKHIEELIEDFIVIPKEALKKGVVLEMGVDLAKEEPVCLELHNPVSTIESEEKMDLILAERGKVLEAIEISMKVLDTEKQCVERQYSGMCDNKRDCEKCDLALDKYTILLGYVRALKCMKHLRDTIIEL